MWPYSGTGIRVVNSLLPGASVSTALAPTSWSLSSPTWRKATSCWASGASPGPTWAFQRVITRGPSGKTDSRNCRSKLETPLLRTIAVQFAALSLPTQRSPISCAAAAAGEAVSSRAAAAVVSAPSRARMRAA